MERTYLDSSESPPSTQNKLLDNTTECVTDLINAYNGQPLRSSNINLINDETPKNTFINVTNNYYSHPDPGVQQENIVNQRSKPLGEKIWIAETVLSTEPIKKKILLAPFSNDENMVYISDSSGYSIGPYHLSDKNADYLAYNIWLHKKKVLLEATALIPEEHLVALCRNYKVAGRFGDDWVLCPPEQGSRLPDGHASALKKSRERLNSTIKKDLGHKLFKIRNGFIHLSPEYEYLLTPYHL